MAGRNRLMTVRGVSVVVLLAVVLLSIIVVIRDVTSPESMPIPPATALPTALTAPLTTPLPSTGRVIGVMAVPGGWQSLRSPGLPFMMGYPPGWRVQQISTNGAPTVILVNAQRRRTLTITGRRLRRNDEAHDALARLAVTPVPHTFDPPVFLRSYPYVPSHSQVTIVVAFVQAGQLWTAHLIQMQDVHLPAGLHELQAVLATFRVR